MKNFFHIPFNTRNYNMSFSHYWQFYRSIADEILFISSKVYYYLETREMSVRIIYRKIKDEKNLWEILVRYKIINILSFYKP